MERTYICVDLKSFYASVEAVARGLDPLKDNLVVADETRGNTTICLAITPAMKALGIRNRCRLFEIPEGVKYTTAKPRMRSYMEVSADIYAVYLRFVSSEDIYPYSIDECFIDATPYLAFYHVDARTFAKRLMAAVFDETGICATAGIGTNLFLAKVALDVTAKHAPDGIGVLDEASFRQKIWFHHPITDIWGIGPGIARRLAKHGAYDLAGVAALREQVLYREFGVNAEFLIDHAWGQEPCTLAEIRSYQPQGHSLSNSQILPCNYSFDEARIVLREMVDTSSLELVEKGLVANHVSLGVGYARPKDRPRDIELFDGGHGKRAVGGRDGEYTGGGRKLAHYTSSTRELAATVLEMYDRTTHRELPIRRLSIGIGGLEAADSAPQTLFDASTEDEGRERRLQEAMVAVRAKFGKNAMLKAASLQEKATARDRNQQIGGHHA